MVKRNKTLLRGITRDMLGLEIAPWLAPIASKRDGYNIKTLDIFDRQTLLERAAADPTEKRGPERLEDVDYVGSATDIAKLVPETLHGQFDYIVSSHNFEHLPDPIRFLQGCERVLKAGGVLSMVVPDRRACFDCFRPFTEIADWIEAYEEERKQPTRYQAFSCASMFAVQRDRHGKEGLVNLSVPINRLHCKGDLLEQWETLRAKTADQEYLDTHCTVMTPASLELLLVESRALGLIGLEVDEVTKTKGIEFLVRLRKAANPSGIERAALIETRTRLKRAIIRENGVYFWGGASMHTHLKKVARFIRGVGRRLRGRSI
jgi:SAM-dependent methyltransferase